MLPRDEKSALIENKNIVSYILDAKNVNVDVVDLLAKEMPYKNGITNLARTSTFFYNLVRHSKIEAKKLRDIARNITPSIPSSIVADVTPQFPTDKRVIGVVGFFSGIGGCIGAGIPTASYGLAIATGVGTSLGGCLGMYGLYALFRCNEADVHEARHELKNIQSRIN